LDLLLQLELLVLLDLEHINLLLLQKLLEFHLLVYQLLDFLFLFKLYLLYLLLVSVFNLLLLDQQLLLLRLKLLLKVLLLFYFLDLMGLSVCHVVVYCNLVLLDLEIGVFKRYQR